MARYEYQVVPAPSKGVKAKGVKSAEARFAHALETLMNEMGSDGWEYQRADTLPSVERSGLTGSTTNWRHVLVFRRALDVEDHDAVPAMPSVAAPVAAAVAAAPAVAAPVVEAIEETVEEAHDVAEEQEVTFRRTASEDDPHPAGQPGATEMLSDDGVEEISDVSGVTTSLETLAATRKGSDV